MPVDVIVPEPGFSEAKIRRHGDPAWPGDPVGFVDDNSKRARFFLAGRLYEQGSGTAHMQAVPELRPRSPGGFPRVTVGRLQIAQERRVLVRQNVLVIMRGQ